MVVWGSRLPSARDFYWKFAILNDLQMFALDFPDFKIIENIDFLIGNLAREGPRHEKSNFQLICLRFS